VQQAESRAISVVIIGMSESVGRVHYEGEYEEGVSSPPVCWSADGKAPDVRSAKPQAKSCDGCPSNIGGSGKGETKACRYIRHLAVVLENDMGGDVYKISLPATSMFGAAEGKKMPLEAYRKLLKGHDLPIDCVVTEMRFDTDAATPKIIFRAVRPLEEKEFHTCQERANSEETTKAVVIEFTAATKTNKASAFETPVPKATSAKAPPKEEDEEPSLPATFKAVRPEPVEVVEEEDLQPKRRVSKKEAPVASTPSVADVLDKWADDDED